MINPFHACGDEIRRLRVASGIATQGELAKLLDFTQQTVSRWEAGLSRPRADQVSLLAKVLRADPHKLLRMAGYAKEQVEVSFDQPLPFASLTPEGFQRFCRSLLEALYPGAKIHAEGKTGHEQFGTDITVITPADEVHSFQCKRERQFGAQKVKDAVRAHTKKANRKFILLSRVASPGARREIEKHKGWNLWDQDDLSEKLRSLAMDDQKRLVDTYFPGQRFALLGEPSPGPWLTPDAFFAPFLAPDRAFSHHWELVGRTNECEELASALSDYEKEVVSLIGPAGGGKSRTLRTALATFAQAHPVTKVLMLSPTEQVTTKSLEDLTRGDKLLVVDDAHDRADLELLVRYVANTEMNARLLLVHRPYAREFIDRQLASYGLVGNRAAAISLQAPTKADAVLLATQVLKSFGKSTSAAAQIAEVAFDSPLSVVVGAWIVANEGLHPQLFGSNEVFKKAVLLRYKEAIAKSVSTNTKDRESTDKLLRVIALVQPVVPDDPNVLALYESIEGVSVADATRMTKQLIASGVLFKRGKRYRLSPDLLADSIIDSSYISSSGDSNGQAEHVFSAAGAEYKAHLLLNLGRLDWRRNEGDTSQSRLLESLWNALAWEDDYRHVQVKAAVEVAPFQPSQALRFAERLIREGHGSEQDVCRLIRNSAYSLRYVPRACELLWEIGQNDARPTNQHPNHPIRLLTEMAEPEPQTPPPYLQAVADYMLSLLQYDESWSGVSTPFTVLQGAFETEGHFTSLATRRAITLTAYGVDQQAVASLRRSVIDSILESLPSSNKRRAFEAAALLRSALHGPTGIMNRRPSQEERTGWDVEFEDTLEKVNSLLKTIRISPTVLMRVAESVSWHALYANGKTNELAQRILLHLDRDLTTRVIRVLMDGWGNNTWKHALERQNLNEEIHDSLGLDLDQAFPETPALAKFLDGCLRELKAHSHGSLQSAHLFIHRLIRNRPALARAVLEFKVQYPESPIASFAEVSLAILMKHSLSEAVSRMEVLLQLGDSQFPFVARAYSAGFAYLSALSDWDRAFLQRIFSSNDPPVVRCTPWMFREIAERDRLLAVELLASASPTLMEEVGDDIFMWLRGDKLVPLEAISDAQLERITKLLGHPARLEQHWIREFLTQVAKRCPRIVVELAQDRLLRAVASEDWTVAAVGNVTGEEPSFGVLEHPEGPGLLRATLDWALEHADNYRFSYCFADLVTGVFGFRDPTCFAVLGAWIEHGEAKHFRLLGQLLREAPSALVFDQPSFVEDVLKAARNRGKSVHRDMTFAFYASAAHGMRSGTVGEPFPEDLVLKDRAQRMLSTMSKAHPAFGLYDDLVRHAEDNIKRSVEEAKEMDEEDAA